MLPKRMHITKSATETLKMFKGRTGVTPNVACRLALMVSLEEGKLGGAKKVDVAGSEFNAATLFGEHATVIEALLRQVHGNLDAKHAATVISSHIDHGLERLRRARSIEELLAMVK